MSAGSLLTSVEVASVSTRPAALSVSASKATKVGSWWWRTAWVSVLQLFLPSLQPESLTVACLQAVSWMIDQALWWAREWMSLSDRKSPRWLSGSSNLLVPSCQRDSKTGFCLFTESKINTDYPEGFHLTCMTLCGDPKFIISHANSMIFICVLLQTLGTACLLVCI